MILLQILDEGSVTDSQGRKVDFKVRIYYTSVVHHMEADYTYLLYSEHYYLSNK